MQKYLIACVILFNNPLFLFSKMFNVSFHRIDVIDWLSEYLQASFLLFYCIFIMVCLRFFKIYIFFFHYSINNEWIYYRFFKTYFISMCYPIHNAYRFYFFHALLKNNVQNLGFFCYCQLVCITGK